MKNAYDMPPLGTAPFYIPAESRIRELAQAIDRNAESGATAKMVEWAKEIIEQCRLIDSMKKVQREEAGNR